MTSNRPRHNDRPLWLVALLLVLTAAQTASAENVLFTGTMGQQQPFQRVWDEVTAGEAATLVLKPSAGGGQSFTIPSLTFSGMYSFHRVL